VSLPRGAGGPNWGCAFEKIRRARNAGLRQPAEASSANFAANDVRATFDAEKLKRDLAEVERLQKTEVPSGVPMTQWAMGWCLRNLIVSSVICGCKNPGQVSSNADAAGLVAE